MMASTSTRPRAILWAFRMTRRSRGPMFRQISGQVFTTTETAAGLSRYSIVTKIRCRVRSAVYRSPPEPFGGRKEL
jgi:hypothetical protein